MSKIKIYEDDSKFIEVSDDDAEILACKQLFNPINSEYSNFIFENFEDKFFKNEVRKKLFKIGVAFWKKYEVYPSEETALKIFNNETFQDNQNQFKKEYYNVINFKEDQFPEKYVKDTLIKFTKMRKIYFTMLEQFEDIEQNGEIGDCLGRFEKIIQLDMLGDLGVQYFSNLNKHCNDLMKLESRQKFGFDELDKMTYGGMPTNDTCLCVIMAQPGLGKSQFMMNVAYNWVLANKKVLMISLEMSEDMYSRRMDGLFADLNVNKLRENVGLLKTRVNAVKLAIPQAQLRIKEFPTGTCSAATIKQYLKKLKNNGFVPDLICVDYLNIMKPSSYKTGMNLYEKCAAISEELRAISCELKVPILTATQANRCLFESTIVNEETKGNIKLKDVQIGDKLLSNNGKYNSVIKKYEIENKKTYKIITKSGKIIICTDIHEWPTNNGNKTILSGLKVGDKLIRRTLFTCVADKITSFMNTIKKAFKHF